MKKLLLIFVVLTAMLAFTACGSGDDVTDTPQDSGETGETGETTYRTEINVALDVDAETYNPIQWKNTTAQRVGQLIYDGLVRIDADLTAVPALASSWETPDETTWIFHLEEGVKFHDGSDCTADDVKYTYEQVLDEANNAPYRSRYTAIESIDVIDDYTIQFNLSEANSALLVYMDMGIIPEGAMDDPGFSSAPIGTGPYKVTSYELNNLTVLTANDEYWGGTPATETINVYIISDNSVRLAALESGDVDFICSPLTASDLQLVEGKEGIVMNKVPGLGITYLGFNIADPIIGDLAVRQAIAYMTDKETIASVIYSGMDIPGNTPLLSFSWANDTSITGYPYDAAMAEQVLDEAGWVDSDGDGIREKDGQKLSFTLSTHSDDTSRFQVVEYLQNALNGIGMDVSVDVTEWATFSQDMLDRKCQVWVAGWLNLYDPDRMYDMFHSSSGSNYGAYNNPEVDAALELGRASSDQETRAEAYQTVAKIVTDEVYYVTLLEQAYISIHTDKLEGYEVYPSGSIWTLWQSRIAE